MSRPRGFVPDSLTAIRIGTAVLTPIYGSDQIASEQPFHAELRGKLWRVYGTLKYGPACVAIAEIAKSDGRIVRASHGK
jgi:hypothetical protein